MNGPRLRNGGPNRQTFWFWGYLGAPGLEVPILGAPLSCGEILECDLERILG